MKNIFGMIGSKLFVFFSLLIVGYANADGPTPTVSIAPSGSHGFPFSSSGLNLRDYGYVEEEFFIAGTAQAYTNDGVFGNDGVWSARPNPGLTASYKTRLLVRRPVNGRFNGTVIVEWLNVTAGREGSPDWSFTYKELLREGYAYVAVSAQYLGVAFNQQWDPARYATLAHPGDSFSYDIFSQAARAIELSSGGNPKPLGNLTSRVRAIIAAGESQSASRLWTYYNAVHPEDKVFDGFLIHSMGVGAALSQSYAAIVRGSPNQIIPAPAGVPATPDIAVPGGAGAVIRADQKEPVLFLNAETDVSGVFGFPGLHSQPDSAVFRLWEVTGTAHGDKYLLDTGAIDSAKSGIPFALDCGNPPVNSGPHTFVARAAVHSLNKWVRTGVPAPVGPRFNLVGFALERDPVSGIVTSGIKLPQVAVPVATLTGVRPQGAVASNPFCVLFGATDPWNGNGDAWDGVAGFDPLNVDPDLRALYPTRHKYLRQYKRALAQSVKQGFVRPRDVKEVYQEAAAADLWH